MEQTGCLFSYVQTALSHPVAQMLFPARSSWSEKEGQNMYEATASVSRTPCTKDIENGRTTYVNKDAGVKRDKGETIRTHLR